MPRATPRRASRGGIERLPRIEATTRLVGEALGADKIDAYRYLPENQTLRVAGLSDTPMSKRQVAIGMDRLAVAEGGRLVDVFQTGTSYATGHADQDPELRRGFTDGLGIRSMLATPPRSSWERGRG